MLCTDRIIVLSRTRYSDSSIIIQALSRQHGRVSLMAYGLGGKNRSRLGAFHAMALLDVVYSYRQERQVQKLSEYKSSPILTGCAIDLRKSTMLMFLAEVVGKSIREEAEDDAQFEFIDTSIQILEQLQSGIQLFHIAFLLKLSRYLGFSPTQLVPGQQFFDLEAGHGTIVRPVHRHYIAAEQFAQLYQFLDLPFNQLDQIKIARAERDFLLETVLVWYSFHIPTMREINSLSVLRDVFNG